MRNSAYELVQRYLSQSLLTETFEYYLDYFSEQFKDVWWDGVKEARVDSIINGKKRDICLPWGPFCNVTGFDTFADSDPTTAIPFDASNYNVDNIDRHGRISLGIGATWPTTVLRTNNGIRITFTAGFGVGSDVPAALRQAVLETLASLYEMRGDGKSGLPHTAVSLCAPYRWNNL